MENGDDFTAKIDVISNESLSSIRGSACSCRCPRIRNMILVQNIEWRICCVLKMKRIRTSRLRGWKDGR